VLAISNEIICNAATASNASKAATEENAGSGADRASAGMRGSMRSIHIITRSSARVRLEEGPDHEENISAESDEATSEARF
jgi:hypothetical protein